MKRIGVTRIGEVTYLDRNGVPGFIAVRPRDKDPGISYYNGKGSTKNQAMASAMMEAIERYSGEFCDLPRMVETIRGLRRQIPYVDPRDLTAPFICPIDDDSVVEWVAGYDLVARRSVLVPLNSVLCPYESKVVSPFAYSSTNGLASGSTRCDALCHALCEINERDAMALASTEIGLVHAIAEVINVGEHRGSALRRNYPEISHDGLPQRSARVLGKLKAAGLTVYLRDITSDTCIPTVDCTVVENLGGAFKAHAGFGSHPDARVALLRALTEAAQSRVACIQGGREDLPEFADKSLNIGDPDQTFKGARVISFSEIPTSTSQSVRDDVNFLLERLARAGLNRIIAVDLTRPELGIPVVRVVVPSAESWSVFHLHTRRGSFGKRVRKILRESC